MATERIVIIVSEDGTEQVIKKINSVGQTSKESAGSVKFLQDALAAFGAAATLKGAVDLIDTYQNLENRLNIVSASQDEVGVSMQKLTAISNQTRTSLETTVDLYARTVLNTEQLGISHEQAARLVQTLNEAVLISGATTREANAALIQFSQGLASGTLRGQELRSVLQQMPIVADLISTKLGVTRGALRQLGAEGRINADAMVSALLGASDKIDKEFSKTVPTVAQTLQQLQTQLVAFAGKLNEQFQIIPKISAAITFLGQNIDTIARVVLAGSFVLGVEKAISVLNLLAAAIAANPIGFIATAVALGVTALIAFSDELKLSGDSAATLADFFAVVFDDIKKTIADAVNYFSTNFGVISNTFRDIFGKDFDGSLKSWIQVYAKGVDGFVGAFIGAGAAIKQVFTNLGASIELIFKGAINGVLATVEAMINKIIAGYNQIAVSGVGKTAGLGTIDLVNVGRVDYSPEALDQGAKIKAAFLKGFDYQGTLDYVNQTFQKASDTANQRLAQQAQKVAAQQRGLLQFQTPQPVDASLKSTRDLAIDQQIQKLTEEGQALQKVGVDREAANQLLQIENQLRNKGITLTAQERSSLTDKIKENDLLKEKATLVDSVEGAMEKSSRQQQILNDLVAQGGKYTDQYAEKLRQLQITQLEAQRDTASGFQAGFLKVGSDITNFASQSEKVVTDAFSGMEDAMVSFVKTGKLSFSSMVDSMLADLTRLLFRQALAGLLSSIPGLGGAGGIIGAIAGAKAGGGDVSGGKAYLVGEKGPELFQPASSGTIVPNSVLTGGGDNNVHVTVVNVTDPNDAISALSGAQGEKVVMNHIRKNKTTVNQTLKS